MTIFKSIAFDRVGRCCCCWWCWEMILVLSVYFNIYCMVKLKTLNNFAAFFFFLVRTHNQKLCDIIHNIFFFILVSCIHLWAAALVLCTYIVALAITLYFNVFHNSLSCVFFLCVLVFVHCCVAVVFLLYFYSINDICHTFAS